MRGGSPFNTVACKEIEQNERKSNDSKRDSCWNATILFKNIGFPEEWQRFGLTIHSKAEIIQEVLPDVDYIGMGPFRKSETKTDLEAKLSLKDFSEMINSVHPVPVYLIGGLAIEDLRLCEQLGNNGIALCSALTDGKSLDTSAITNYVNKASDLEKNVVLAWANYE